MELNVPVLFVAFNRPEITLQSFNYIRAVKPAKLYVALDGPRSDKHDDIPLCRSVKKIVEDIDWPCDVSYCINQKNKGAEITISSAITWVLDKELYVIILEDDILAPKSFFYFMQEMLIRYKKEERIATVSGSNFTPIKLQQDYDYFFAKYGHSWGWGTWKRFWEKFNLEIEVKDEHLSIEFLKSICNSQTEIKYYQRMFKQVKEIGPGKSTWDTVGLYIFRINNYLSIIPRINLTSNIGVFGLHSNGITDCHNLPFDENFTIRNHPEKIECFTKYDKQHFKTFINRRKTSLYKRIYLKTMKLFRNS